MRHQFLFTALGAFTGTVTGLVHLRDGSENMVSTWDNIAPSPDLKWTPCFEKFFCAKLEVPLDYEDSNAGTTSIAYTKLPAEIDPENAEDILVNPGGPGESGVELVQRPEVRSKLGYGSRYNIVGFDPRAVGHSGPTIPYLDCLEKEPHGTEKAKMTWCRKQFREGEGRYTDTAAVVQDMLRYIEKRAIALGEPPEESKLWYNGFSYGTVIGATFASMYPNRVGRLVLDGVVDSRLHYNGHWSEASSQITEIIDDFPVHCWRVGPDRCRFYSNTTSDIRGRIKHVYKMLTKPICTEPNRQGKSYLVSAGTLNRFLLRTTYTPAIGFPEAARVFSELEYNQTTNAISKYSKEDENRGPGPMISCIDAIGSHLTLTPRANSPGTDHILLFGSMPNADEFCKWKQIPPKSQRFRGFHEAQKNTSFPILFISTVMDPVTPIQGANQMHSYFPNSVLLTQNSIGHASISTPSNCTLEYISDYYDGVVPEPNTKCEPNFLPFEDDNALVIQYNGTTLQEKYLNLPLKGHEVYAYDPHLGWDNKQLIMHYDDVESKASRARSWLWS